MNGKRIIGMRSILCLMAGVGGLLLSPSQAQTQVSNSDAFENAVKAAKAGTVVEVADGKYDIGYLSLTTAGTEASPIVIRAKNRGKAELMGNSSFTFKPGSAYIVVEGFVFTGSNTAVKMDGAHHIRITRNVFRLNETSSLKWVFIGGANSHHNRIDHNLFEEKKVAGSFITVDGDSYSDKPTLKSSQYDVIEYNHFRNNTPRAANEKESIRVGWSEISMSSGFTTVQFNLFEKCDGDPEVVSVKTCDNIIRFNTFKASQGTLSLRHGNRTTVEGNVFLGEGREGTGGIRICGEDHKIFNNYLEGLAGTGWDAPLAITNGDASGTSGALNSHFIANRVLVAHNTFVNNAYGLEFGHSTSKYKKPPGEITVVNNLVSGSSNTLFTVITAPTKLTFSGNMAYASGTAKLGVEPKPEGIQEADPKLVKSGGLWHLGSGSPAMNAAQGAFPFLTLDMDGQTRSGKADVGADEAGAGKYTGAPLDAAAVGPNSPETASGIPLALSSGQVRTGRTQGFQGLGAWYSAGAARDVRGRLGRSPAAGLYLVTTQSER